MGQRPLAAHGKIWKQKTVGFWFLEYLVSSMHLFSFDFDDIFTYICFIRCTFCIYVSIKMLKVEKISTTTNKRKCTCISYMYTHSYDIKYLFDRLKTKRNTKSSNFLANDASFSLILNVIWIFFSHIGVGSVAVKCKKKKLHFEMYLTEVAGEGGTDCPPQKFLLSQQFRYLMRCKKYLKKIFLSCLVSEIQLFVYIFGWISKWPPEVRKGSLVKFFEVSYYQKNFQPPTVPNSQDRGGMKMPYDFFVYICDF